MGLSLSSKQLLQINLTIKGMRPPNATTNTMDIMVYSDYTGTGPGLVKGPNFMESLAQCRNVHTGLRQGQWPEPIVSYCASFVSCTIPGPVALQCEQEGISVDGRLPTC